MPTPNPNEVVTANNIRDEFPLRLTIGGKDCTFLLSESFTFSNTDPGGFEAASFPIPEDMPWVYRGMHVRLDCGTKVAWEGRVREIQRSLGQKTLIQCEGYRAVLKDKTLFHIYIDQDMTKWGNIPLWYQQDIINTVATKEKEENKHSVPSSGTIGPAGTGELPALILEANGPWEIDSRPDVENWFNGQDSSIETVYYEWELGPYINTGDGNWHISLCFSDEFNELVREELEYPAGAAGPNLRVTPSGAEYFTPGGTWWEFSSPKQAVFRLHYAVGGGGANIPYNVYFKKIAVYGGAGGLFSTFPTLTRRGTEDPKGFYPSDIAASVLGAEESVRVEGEKWEILTEPRCPNIQPGVIEEASQYIVPHCSYPTPVPCEQIVSEMARYAAWHWGVWEGREYLTGNSEARLDFRPYPEPGKPTAWCYRNECETLDVRESIENLYNEAEVNYTEPGGEELSVRVTRACPPLTRAGLKRCVALSAGTTTKAAAEAFGGIQLQLLEEQANVTGSATITMPIHKMNGGPMAPWMLKSGRDRLRVADLPGENVWGEASDLPISRVECSATSTGLTTSIEFGLGPNLIETLQARLEDASKIALQ